MDFFTEVVESELLIVTHLLWHRKECPPQFSSMLDSLSAKSMARPGAGKIKVRICLTTMSSDRSYSRSYLSNSNVKFFDCNSEHWSKDFGIAHQDDLPGLDIKVGEIFINYRLDFRRYKVEWNHPNFIIVDRKLCLLPSCHAVGPHWKDGCLFIRGPAVDFFVSFWLDFWVSEEERAQEMPLSGITPSADAFNWNRTYTPYPPAVLRVRRDYPSSACEPYNISALFELARHSVFIQASRIFHEDIKNAILDTLARGVHVHLVTSEENELWHDRSLRNRYGNDRYLSTITGTRRVIRVHEKMRRLCAPPQKVPGRLRIDYFRPRDDSMFAVMLQRISIIDQDMVIFGHGTIGHPRSSLFSTDSSAQDIGVVFVDSGVASAAREAAEMALKDRVTPVYDSESSRLNHNLPLRLRHSRLSSGYWFPSEAHKDADRFRSAWLEPKQPFGT